MCFKRDNNVRACALNALILLPGRKSVTGKGFSDIDFLYNVVVYFGDFSLRMRSFDYIITSSLKSDVTFEFTVPVFL